MHRARLYMRDDFLQLRLHHHSPSGADSALEGTMLLAGVERFGNVVVEGALAYRCGGRLGSLLHVLNFHRRPIAVAVGSGRGCRRRCR